MRFLQLIRENEVSEFLAYFPEYTDEVASLAARISLLTEYLDGLYESTIQLRHAPRKEAAETIKASYFPEYLFLLLDGKVGSPEEWLWDYYPCDEGVPNWKVMERLERFEKKRGFK
jgi:hypothetical protein